MKCAVHLVCLVALTASAEPLTLPELIERARTQDLRVKEAQAQLRYYRAKYDEAKWAWFPRIDSYVAVAGPTPEARNDGLGGPPTTHATLMYDLDFGKPGVQLSARAEGFLPLYTFGKLSALKEAGARGVEAGEALTWGAADEAELQVAQAYYGLCLAQASRESVGETLKRLEDAKATLKRLRGQGSEQVSQLDLYRVDYYQDQLEAQLAAVGAGEGFALAAIRLLIGAAPGETVDVAVRRLDEPIGGLLPVDAYVDVARSHRPELKAVTAALAAKEREVFIRERMFFPDVGLAGYFHWAWTTSTTRQLSPFAYDPYNDLTAGVALAMRYQWDFPQKGIAVEQAQAELERLRHQESLAVAGVKLEIERLWNDTNAALKRSAKQTQAEKMARRWASAAFAAFDVGTGETRELVDAFTALAMASAQRGQAYYDVQVGLRGLARAVGEPVTLSSPSPEAAPAALTPGERGGAGGGKAN